MKQPKIVEASEFTLQPKPIVTAPVLKDMTPEGIFAEWQKDRSPELGSQLLAALAPHIEHSARKWSKSANPVTLGRARVLAIEALPRYEPGRASLATYIDRQLQPLQRWSARKNLGIKVQTGLVQDLRHLQDAETHLQETLGRAPSYIELADHSGIPLARIAKLQQMHLPLIGEATRDGEDGNKLYAEDQAVEDNEDLWQKTVYHSLSPIDQVVMQHTLGLYGARPMSNEAIARKLKVSPGAVSQRKAKIQQLLDSTDSDI